MYTITKTTYTSYIYIYYTYIYIHIYIHKYDMRILKQTMNVVHSRNYEKNPTKPKVFPP